MLLNEFNVNSGVKISFDFGKVFLVKILCSIAVTSEKLFFEFSG